MLAAIGDERSYAQQQRGIGRVDSQPMDLRGRYIPPARDHGALNDLRDEVAPDERLLARGDQEVLLCLGQCVGQRRERSYETASGVRGPTRADQLGILPRLVRALDADEIVAADE